MIKTILDILAVLERYPKFSLFVGILIGAVAIGSFSAGAFATKGMVMEKHELAMQKIDSLDKSQGRIYEEMERLEKKIDFIILKVRD